MELSNKQKKFYKYLDSIIKNNKLSHAYLIEIDDYEEDFNDILNFVKMIELNCLYDSIDEKNNIVKQIDNNIFSDLYIIEPDGAFVKKNQVLSLQEEFQNKSLYGNKRVYIIKEAEKLNMSSANTILKFLEEPEEDLVAILLTTNRYKMIKTIISRCQILNFKGSINEISSDEETMFLLENIINKKAFINYNKIITDIIPDKNIAKEKLIKVEELLLGFINKTYKNEIFKDISNDEVYNIVLIIEEEMGKLIYNINYKMWLDNLFSRIILGGNYD
jgi:DNA polymerase III delta prime subunit